MEITPELQRQLDYLAELGPHVTAPDDPNAHLLNPHLRASWVELRPGEWAIKHPWVNLPFGVMVGQANKTFDAKFRMMRQLLQDRRLDTYLMVAVERPWRMSTLERWWDRENISAFELLDLLPAVWADAEFPSTNLVDPAHLWHEACQYDFPTDDEGAWERVPDPVTIYRGGTSYGISWTLDRDKAEWFAKRFGDDDDVWKATVPKGAVLGFVNSRGEAEVIVDPQTTEMEIEAS